MDLRITGLEQVQRALQDSSRLIVAASFARALDRAAGVFAAEVALQAAALGDSDSDTPLAEHVKTSVEVDTHKRGGIADVGFDQTQDERTGIPQDLKAYLIEYGHFIVTHKPEKDVRGFVRARPFMRAAFEAAAERAIEAFADSLIDTLSSLR